MSLTESIVEDATLEWLGELGYAVGHRPHLASGEPAAERDSFDEVALVDRLRKAIRGLSPAISECPTLARWRDPVPAILTKLLIMELSVTTMKDAAL